MPTSEHSQLASRVPMPMPIAIEQHIDPIADVGTSLQEKKGAVFNFSAKFFLCQVATSSISNIIGTVAGHPLDTIRVSIAN